MGACVCVCEIQCVSGGKVLRADDMKLTDFHLNCCSYRSFFFCFLHISYIWTWSPAIPSAQDIFKVYQTQLCGQIFLVAWRGRTLFIPSVSSVVFSKTAPTVRA